MTQAHSTKTPKRPATPVAYAEWDGAGNNSSIPAPDLHDDGTLAANRISRLVTGLQPKLAKTQDTQDNSYALIPMIDRAAHLDPHPDKFGAFLLVNGVGGLHIFFLHIFLKKSK